MADVTKINITQEDLAQSYLSGYADGSVVREKTAVPADYHQKLQRSFTALTLSNSEMAKKHRSLISSYNHIADCIVSMQRVKDQADRQALSAEDALNQLFGTLDALGEVSPF